MRFYVLPNSYVLLYVQEEDKNVPQHNLTNTTDTSVPGFGYTYTYKFGSFYERTVKLIYEFGSTEERTYKRTYEHTYELWSK